MRTLLINLLTVLFIVLFSFSSLAEEKTFTDPTSADPQYSSVEERRLLVALETERSNLARERKILEEKKKELKRLEIEVDKKLDLLVKTRQLIQQMITEKDEEELRKIKELSKMYDKMSADKAARVLSSLEQNLAIAILENMKTKTAAKVLNSMERDKAARLTTAFSNLENQ